MHAEPKGPAQTPSLPDGERRPMASMFDSLVASTLQLNDSVGKLVRLTYAVLAFNALLVAIVIGVVWGRR
jgi:hypothetical protein